MGDEEKKFGKNKEKILNEINEIGKRLDSIRKKLEKSKEIEWMILKKSDLYCENCETEFKIQDVEKIVFADYEQNSGVPLFGLVCPECGSCRDYSIKKTEKGGG